MNNRVADFLIITFALFSLRLAGAVLSPDNCSQSVNIPELSFSTSPLSCAVVWHDFNFILRHYYDKPSQTLSIVLSADTAGNWFSMGFSPTGAMVGSSAMVGYMSVEGGDGILNQYYLNGKTSDQVFVHQGNLTVVPESGVVTLQNQTIYMAFQLDIVEPAASSNKVIYAYAPRGRTPNSSGYILGPHQADYGMSIDFTTGLVSSTSNPTLISNITTILRRSHGVVNVLAWAIVAPIGAFIARYLRQWQSVWFPLHVGFQATSYLLGVGGVILGIRLSHELPAADWKRHRVVGIFVLFLATLQVLAMCARPNKDSKHRRTWNWYHYLLGRFLLFLAAVNIVIGLEIADASRPLKAGYAFILLVTLLAFSVLESIYWFRWWKRHNQSQTPFATYEMRYN